MPINTPYLGLKTYSTLTDASNLFLSFRNDIAGVATETNSNMVILDTFATATSASIVTLQGKKVPVDVSGSVIVPGSGDYFATGITDITSYTNGLLIILSVNESAPGTCSLNINSIGTKSLQKIDKAGNYVNLTINDLIINRKYLFEYNGTSWIWIGAISPDQITISGSSSENNLLTISSSGTMMDSGTPISILAPASGSYLVLELNPGLSHQWLLSSGSGIVLRQDTDASAVLLDLGTDTNLTTTTGSLALTATGVVSGSYTIIQVDSYGRITSGSNLSWLNGTTIQSLILTTSTNVSLVTGTATFNQTFHTLVPESGTSDNLDTIQGMFDGGFAILTAYDPGVNTIVIKNGTGNISCFGGYDISLSEGMVLAARSGSMIYIAGGGGASGGGHIIQDNGSTLPQEGILNFTGAGITSIDDSPNNATVSEVDWNKHSTTISASTVVTIPAGVGSIVIGGFAVEGQLVVNGTMVIL